MTARGCRLAAIVALATIAATGRAVADDTPVDDIVGELSSMRWSASYAEWRTSRSTIACRPAQSLGNVAFLDDEWVYRCERQTGRRIETWFFYVLDVPGPPTARLEQFRAVLDLPVAQRDDAVARCAASLSQLYGTPERPARISREFGAAFWQDVHRWKTALLEILLYRDAMPLKPPSIGLLVRHRPLADRRAADEGVRDGRTAFERSDDEFDDALSRALTVSHPHVGTLLTEARRSRELGVRSAPDRFTAGALGLIDDAERAAGDQRPALLLAVDRTASAIVVEQSAASAWDTMRTQLAARGLHFDWSELGGVWVYQHDALWRVWRDHADSAWGEWAFLLLLQRGWDTSVGCAKGSDQFRTVISEGERFLGRRPRSRHRVPVLFAIALANETWWSLSQASPEDNYAEAARYRTGADFARRQAIRRYEEIFRLAPDDPASRHARRVLGRLRLGLATNERSFFCVYD